jgi:glycosyltransferase involved in cell wall biosynthesis
LKSEKKHNLIKRKPKQVVYVWNYLEWGGAQVYFLGIAARIKDRTNVKFVFPGETSRQFIGFCENLGIDYEFLESVADFQPAPNFRRKMARHFNKIRSEISLLRFLRRFDFDESILHIELAPWQSALALSWLGRRAKVFMTMHNALPSVSKWRKLLWKLKFSIVTRVADFHVFASNRDAKNSLKPFVPKGFFDKIEVTYTNVNPDEIDAARRAEFNRAATLKKFGLPEGKFLVFCLGQFIDRKGRWIFLEAAKSF